MGTYAYDAATGRLAPVTAPAAAASRYAYEANGNTLSGDGRAMSWTSGHRLAEVCRGAATLRFAHAQSGGRHRQVAVTEAGTVRMPGLVALACGGGRGCPRRVARAADSCHAMARGRGGVLAGTGRWPACGLRRRDAWAPPSGRVSAPGRPCPHGFHVAGASPPSGPKPSGPSKAARCRASGHAGAERRGRFGASCTRAPAPAGRACALSSGPLREGSRQAHGMGAGGLSSAASGGVQCGARGLD